MSLKIKNGKVEETLVNEMSPEEIVQEYENLKERLTNIDEHIEVFEEQKVELTKRKTELQPIINQLKKE